MRTIYHPTLSATREVPDEAVEGWREAGWRLTPPKADRDDAPETHDSPAAATAADQGQRPSENEGD